jgi:hypothetical protein
MTQDQKVDILIATKVTEDALIAKVTEPVFDDWLDRLPYDIEPIAYLAIIKAMLDNIRKYAHPTQKQIELILDLGFANLKYSA